MSIMNLRKIRSVIRLLFSLLLCWLYLPHVLFGIFNRLVRSDLKRIEYQIGLKLPLVIQLIYHLHNNKY